MDQTQVNTIVAQVDQVAQMNNLKGDNLKAGLEVYRNFEVYYNQSKEYITKGLQQ